MLTPTQRALLELCRVRPDPAERRAMGERCAGVDWTELGRLAVRGGVAGLVARNLEGLEAPRLVRLALTRAALVAQAHNQLLLGEGHRLCVAAEAEGLSLVPLKGTALNFLGIYDDPGLRAQCDLDLLVRREQLREVDRLLRRLGLSEDTTHRDYALRHSHHLKYHRPDAPLRVMLELHWTGLLTHYTDREVERAILDRAVPRAMGGLGGQTLRLLRLEDLLFLVILHFCVHRYRAQLKWLVDIAELARCTGPAPDWGQVYALARRVGALRATVLAVELARRLLGAPIPAPPVHPRLLPLLARLNPAEALVTSQPQPAWRQRAAVDLLAYDSPLHGLRALGAKAGELLERYRGLRLPFARKTSLY